MTETLTFATHSKTASSFKYWPVDLRWKHRKKYWKIFGEYTVVTYLCTPLERAQAEGEEKAAKIFEKFGSNNT